MSDNPAYSAIIENPKFHSMVKRKAKIAWLLTIIILAAYYGFILIIAFSPSVFANTLIESGVTTLGIIAAMSIIFLSVALTGIYVWWANNVYDRLNKEVIELGKQ